MAKEKKVSSEMIYAGKIIDVRKDQVLLPDGRTWDREVVDLADAVAIVAVTDNNEVLMIKQYRHPAGKELLEIPAGKIEPHEAPLTCAKRELEEETGYLAKSWYELGKFYTSPGFSTEQIYIFLARDLTLHDGQKLDQDEFINLEEKMPLDKCLELARTFKIEDAKTIIGLLAVEGHGYLKNS